MSLFLHIVLIWWILLALFGKGSVVATWGGRTRRWVRR